MKKTFVLEIDVEDTPVLFSTVKRTEQFCFSLAYKQFVEGKLTGEDFLRDHVYWRDEMDNEFKGSNLVHKVTYRQVEALPMPQPTDAVLGGVGRNG